MNILVLGSGGREHALSWKIKQSPFCRALFVAPGNAGTASIAVNVPVNPVNFDDVAELCLNEKIDMVVVGPEDPLVNGISDYFRQREDLKHILLIGPDKNAAQLEGSKDFCKAFMVEHNIPTARYQSFTGEDLEGAYGFLDELKPPYVLKADGLAAGKGVLILNDIEEAKTELKAMFSGKFGEASRKVVIEEFLDGIEFSVFILTDGKNYHWLPVAKDYKRIGEGDTGLNTGGMGAVSPVSFVTRELRDKVEERIVKPTIKGIGNRGMDYKGFVFLGLIKVGDEPYVIEYNVRMGDPETEVVIPRIKNDLVEILKATGERRLNEVSIEEDERMATTVMVVSEGYPGSYAKGKVVSGLQNVEESMVFHAGTKLEGQDVVTSGGRVMAFTSYGSTRQEALEKSYNSIKKVCFEGITFRRDIGYDL
ncbi:MAG TPA: phosphoribosylamine--glycine ligase [Cryomorphaceae bacterium]|nr:phosphoribosylamine--glycine ligase [Owenweeksia sp.]HAD97714.1 phosphoribosylamine--glycine ligase [Cryomorphaceae bacterium]HBF20199.1 phosphoribosylamine--glycine ligase [Cryomorphaceae bacterium]|tara:strand:+ start:2311 stop:3579 length:1269 start_codon:yes stop_codon:yes gene_type:complete